MAEEEKKIKIKLPKINIWMISTLVLVIILVISLCKGFSITGRAVEGLSKDQAAKVAIDYINNNLVEPGSSVSLVSVEEFNGLYKVTTSYQGQTVPIYITKDGSYLFLSQPLDTSEEIPKQPEEQQQTEMSCEDIPKKDKPVVELFTFSYCPYGTQYEKGLIPVVELLDDKTNIKVIFIGAMHGLHEEIESKRQLCIREEQSGKYWEYLKCFAYSEGMKECSSKFYREFNRNETKMAECIDPYINECFDKAGIDKSKITDCMENRADNYYETDNQLAKDRNTASSPTIFLNGVKLSGNLAGRSPEAIKNAICCGFEEKPSECEQSLSTETASPGFGGGTSSS